MNGYKRNASLEISSGSIGNYSGQPKFSQSHENGRASFSNALLQLTIPILEETAPKEVKVHVEHAQSRPADGKTS